MKYVLFTALTLFSFSVAADQISSLLSQYDSRELNGKCSIDYEDSILTLEGSETREGFRLLIEEVEDSNGVLVGKYSNYNGTGEVLFLKRDFSLLIIGTWYDNDNGYDSSSFCELTLKGE